MATKRSKKIDFVLTLRAAAINFQKNDLNKFGYLLTFTQLSPYINNK